MNPLYIILLAYLQVVLVSTNQELSRARICQLRCTAKCVLKDYQTIEQCDDECEGRMKDNLCEDRDKDKEFCWKTCGGVLTEGPTPATPNNLHAEYTLSYSINLSWSDNGNFYLVEVSKDNIHMNEYVDEVLTTNNSLTDFVKSKDNFCDGLSFRVSMITVGGVGDFSNSFELPAPAPDIIQNISVASMEYINQTFSDNGYDSNGTIRVILQYVKPKHVWPLGEDDIRVDLLFHMISCDIPDLSKAVPTPQFVPGDKPRTLVGDLGADLMYRRCQFLYYVSAVQSAQCGSINTNPNFDETSMKPLEVDCFSVRNSPCAHKPVVHHPPMCGQVEGFNYHVITKDIKTIDPSTNITVNVSFRSTLSHKKKPLYFVAFYGNARPFDREIDVELLGVDLYNILGNVTNCPKFDENGTCEVPLDTVNVSVIIPGLKLNVLYGVMLCAVLDVKNMEFPPINGVSLGFKSKANKIYVSAAAYRKSSTGLLIGLIAGIIVLLFLLLIGVFAVIQRKQNKKLNSHRIKLEQLKKNDQRYTNLPRRLDIWELERRNLIIYDEQKLGSGAFGSVYKGRLLGIARGNKNAQSTLGINLMRAENCDVAVKMLPEYADELSKSEFLREISLMKMLGYHERLVNMLACIIESEPYCLIVEYCSDGDLLQFLRARCNYMMKLTEMGIAYDYPSTDQKFDPDMVITLKQLLMFAVQISYGLEYLSQKNFVHRDVAARNVLVHEKTNAKIGDFGLCRYIYADNANYKGRGGRLPVKWMSPEAIKHYEFTTQSDVWSFGILMFEIITLGGSPYPGVQPDDMMEHLDAGERMEQPDNCPDGYYAVMRECWSQEPKLRPMFGTVRQKLASLLEEVSDEYSYLKLDSQRDYYNVVHDGETE